MFDRGERTLNKKKKIKKNKLVKSFNETLRMSVYTHALTRKIGKRKKDRGREIEHKPNYDDLISFLIECSSLICAFYPTINSINYDYLDLL